MTRQNDLEVGLPRSHQQVVTKPNIAKQPARHIHLELPTRPSRINTSPYSGVNASNLHNLLAPDYPSTKEFEILRIVMNIIPLCVLGGLFYAMNWTYYRPFDHSNNDFFVATCGLWGIFGLIFMLGNWYCCRPTCTDVPTCGSSISCLIYLLILVGGGFLVRADIFGLAYGK